MERVQFEQEVMLKELKDFIDCGIFTEVMFYFQKLNF